MKYKTKMNKLIFLSIISIPTVQMAHASSEFTSASTITITIDSITNNTNAGNLTGLDIYGLFEVADSLSAPGFGHVATGNGISSNNYAGGEIDSSISPITNGDSFNQSFSSIGSVSDGTVDTYYQAFGKLKFTNTTNDSFTIEYNLNYILDSGVAGDFATNTVVLEYFNDLGDIGGYEEASASTFLNVTNQNASGTAFTLNLSALEKDTFYADVAINGYAKASPVPVPAAGWLMLSGLAFLRHYRKSIA